MISFEFNHKLYKWQTLSWKRYIKIFYVYMVAYHHPGIGLVDKTSRLTREYCVFSAVCLGHNKINVNSCL